MPNYDTNYGVLSATQPNFVATFLDENLEETLNNKQLPLSYQLIQIDKYLYRIKYFV